MKMNWLLVFFVVASASALALVIYYVHQSSLDVSVDGSRAKQEVLPVGKDDFSEGLKEGFEREDWQPFYADRPELLDRLENLIPPKGATQEELSRWKAKQLATSKKTAYQIYYENNPNVPDVIKQQLLEETKTNRSKGATK